PGGGVDPFAARELAGQDRRLLALGERRQEERRIEPGDRERRRRPPPDVAQRPGAEPPALIARGLIEGLAALEHVAAHRLAGGRIGTSIHAEQHARLLERLADRARL